MKKTLIALTIALSFNVLAEESKENYETFSNEKYVLDIHDGVSGGFISLFNLVKGNSGNISTTNEKIIKEKVIEYKDNPETQAKLEEFKLLLNEKLQSDNLTQTFYYKTASDVLSDKQINYLSNIVLSLNNYKELKYSIKGFSDSRGNAEYNKELSANRVNSVLGILQAFDISFDNIKVNYVGEEESSQTADYEELFFDRKVELIISK